MEEALERVIRQEHKVERDDSIRDNKRKANWSANGSDLGTRKRSFKNFKPNKKEYKGNNGKEIKGNSNNGFGNKGSERKGLPKGCFKCGRDYYANQCLNKGLSNQQPIPPFTSSVGRLSAKNTCGLG